MTHATATAFLILCPVTISLYLKGNFTAIYRSPLIKTRKASIAMPCIQCEPFLTQKWTDLKSRFTVTAMAVGITTTFMIIPHSPGEARN